MVSPPEKPCVSNQLFETTSLKQKDTKIASHNGSDPKLNRPQGSSSFLQWKWAFKTNGRGKRKAARGSSSFSILCIKADLQSRKTLISNLISLPTKSIHKWCLPGIVGLQCVTLIRDAAPDSDFTQKWSGNAHESTNEHKDYSNISLHNSKN